MQKFYDYFKKINKFFDTLEKDQDYLNKILCIYFDILQIRNFEDFDQYYTNLNEQLLIYFEGLIPHLKDLENQCYLFERLDDRGK